MFPACPLPLKRRYLDSCADVPRFRLHTAFLEPDVPAGVAPCASIELRTLVFHRE
jgi:hypothetical protein